MGADQKAPRAGGRIADAVTQLRLHQPDDHVDQHARGEVLAGTGFLFVGILLQQALVQVAEAFFLRVVPVELVDLGDQRGECLRLADHRGGVGEDHPGDTRAMRAEVDQLLFVFLEAIGIVVMLEIGPAITGRDALFAGFSISLSIRLFCHLEK